MKLKSITHALLVGLFFLSGAIASPSEASPRCAEVYHVKRPIAASLIWHEYLGIYHDTLEVAGLPKTKEDLSFFRRFIEGEDLSTKGTVLMPQVTYLGKACGARKDQALLVARSHSQKLQQKNAPWMRYLVRMGLTPLLGKPCREAALEITRRIDRFLE